MSTDQKPPTGIRRPEEGEAGPETMTLAQEADGIRMHASLLRSTALDMRRAAIEGRVSEAERSMLVGPDGHTAGMFSVIGGRTSPRVTSTAWASGPNHLGEITMDSILTVPFQFADADMFDVWADELDEFARSIVHPDAKRMYEEALTRLEAYVPYAEIATGLKSPSCESIHVMAPAQLGKGPVVTDEWEEIVDDREASNDPAWHPAIRMMRLQERPDRIVMWSLAVGGEPVTDTMDIMRRLSAPNPMGIRSDVLNGPRP
jgi:hypothetical protein